MTMRIAVASGKGGTGKTTVTVNLACEAADAGAVVALLDCDVEEPNAGLFLQPEIREQHEVRLPCPVVDPDKCRGCGRCGLVCQFSAIVPLNGKVLVFPELCHACGGCTLVCPTGAVREEMRVIGQVETGRAGRVAFVHGILNIGEAIAPPVIRQVRQHAPPAELTLTDAPPGTSCPVIEAVRDVSFLLLVTEPTPFGLHDLRLAVEMGRALELPLGVFVNRSDGEDELIRGYCEDEGIEILGVLPEDRRIAEACSRGEILCRTLPEYRSVFRDLRERLAARVDESLERPPMRRASP